MIRTMTYFAISLIATILLVGCGNQSSSSEKIDFHGFPENEIRDCIGLQMLLNDMQLVRIVSVEETNEYPGNNMFFSADVYLDVMTRKNFRSSPETIRVKMPLTFDSRGTIIGSSIESLE